MKEYKLQLVNTGLEGQPEHAALQDIESGQIFEFSMIYGESIQDGDMGHPLIQKIHNNKFYQVIGMMYPLPDKIQIYFV
jgi:hypothetical protein